MKGTTLRKFRGMVLVAAGCAALLTSARAQEGWGSSKTSSSWGARPTKAETTTPRSIAAGGSSSWKAGAADIRAHGGAGGVWTDGSISAGASSTHAASTGPASKATAMSSAATVPSLATPIGLTRAAPGAGHPAALAGKAPVRGVSNGNHPTMGAHVPIGVHPGAVKTSGGMRRTSAAHRGAGSRQRGSFSQSGSKSGNIGTGLSSGPRSPLESESGLKPLVGDSQGRELGSEMHTLSGEMPH